MIPQEKTYPVFEANQVLSKRHLNELFKYLDEQNRLTRTNLIGVGIVCGLEISPSIDGKTIQLSKGCGITSKGLVAVIPDDNTNKSVKDSIILSRYIDYKVPKGLDYPAFYQKDDITKQYGLWELLSENDPGSQELSNLDLSDKVLLLFVECLEDSLKNCSPNSCDDKGIEVKITIRKLLITKIDLAKIISNSEDLKSALDTDGMVKYLTSRLNLPDLKLRRFNLPNSNVDSAEKIFAAYKEILGTVEESNSSIILEVQNALSKAYLAFYPIIKSIDGMDTDPFLKGQLLNISKHFLQNKSDKNIIYVQYLYDFISDLIQAYDEFRWKGIELLALCCPSEELFPFHLMIGEIYGNDIAGKKVFRHYFRSSAILANQRNLYEEVLSLFQRLVKMVNNFTNPAFLSNNKTIRITPSTLGAFPLSQKAIPFYFDVMKLYEQWSFEKTSVGRANQNHSYFASDQTTYANQDFIKKPLEYDLETFNFFRVEGLIGMDWRDALKDILDKIFRYRLPFDVVALNADNMTVNSDPQPPRCINNDLDIIYKLWQKELACMLATKMSYWTGLNYKTLKYNPVALSATKIELVEETPIKAKILVRPETLKVENKLSETVKPYYNVGTPSSISNVVLNSTLFHEDTLGKAFLDTLKSGKTSDVNG
ncbi:MAG TPA: hypothetical protein VK590_03145, partial [Saprospiraceae bacterium]|nr:hypothetical protein [Saprospiraceae bacterium]